MAFAIIPVHTNQPWWGQLLIDEEKVLIMEGQSWGREPQLPDPASPLARAGKRAASTAHISASLQATMWAVVSATSLTTGSVLALPTGNLFCKARGSTETQKQESKSTTRKWFFVADEVLCVFCVTQRYLSAASWTTAITSGCGKCSEVGARGSSKQPQEQLYKSELPIEPGCMLCSVAPPVVLPKRDIVSLMWCAWLTAHQCPQCVMNFIRRVQDILRVRTSNDIQSGCTFPCLASSVVQEVILCGSHWRNCRGFRLGLLPCRGKTDSSSCSGDCSFRAASCSSAEEALCKGNQLVIVLVELGCSDWALLPNRALAQSGMIPSAKLAAKHHEAKPCQG